MDEKDQAAAYIKLHEDVKKLIIDTVLEEIQRYGVLTTEVVNKAQSNLLYSQNFKDQVKNVIKDQMNKY
jgi:hypothetical protein